MLKDKFKSLSLAGIAIFTAITLINFPGEVLNASERGLDMWWGTVFPSLLPFFITAELLIGFGVVRFIGVLFEPIMRPLFNVPGVGGFVWAMGMASGYPSGAKLTSRLRQENQITKIEAERLVSFTNASNPLFIIGAISVGFFHDEQLGVLLAVCHYLGNAIVGICMRFYGKNSQEIPERSSGRLSIYKALQELHRTRLKEKRPFGKILGDAVINSVQTLLMIGGFIIIFSVFTKLISIIGIATIFASFLAIGLNILGIPEQLALPMFSGLFEITLGAKLISDAEVNSLFFQAIALSFILAFNGFSVQAQVASIIAETDIRFAPYFFSRILHGIFASILVILLYKPLYTNQQAGSEKHMPVWSQIHAQPWADAVHLLQTIGPLVTLCTLALSICILLTRTNNAKAK
ncbi:sporulation integral membrane protein YlbJ [Aquibacillus koreensis]|uniref:Sporulation integral membrane protein YlbJ n=1 Tax=Aquibacillus koreensis TaxID=279446 RepID=A0A9X3WKZ9_9BACI|nr:sporulation integral membrane protein YlbJ [Aquibacillus koreensis]MCT2538077.1 sporulation integral membrane protein YlbJ [Aquibacillus koreensis]MDC3420600.1 sporulation integral membrane protein YlbJ [Aquibacillus koreensis]